MKITVVFLSLILIAIQTFAFRGVPPEYDQTKELKELPGMVIEGKKYMIGTTRIDGVQAIAYLNDLRAKMAEFGLTKTHHLMVEFTDIASGKPVKFGSAAVKIEGPDEATSDAIRLFAMEEGFGADVTLKQKGRYHLIIGTSLLDNKKRSYDFYFLNR
mgnify:CR=1 FL=1